MSEDSAVPVVGKSTRARSASVLLALAIALGIPCGGAARPAPAEREAGPLLLADAPRIAPGAIRRPRGASRPQRFEPLLPREPARRATSWGGPAAASASELAFATTDAIERLGQRYQSTAVLADGSFAAVWNRGSDHSYDAYMQWIDGQGQLVFPNGGKLVAGDTPAAYDPVVVAHATAGALVAFHGGTNILVQSFDASGTPRWPGTGVAAAWLALSEIATEPFLLPDANGGVFVCFLRYPSTPALDVVCQHLDANGTRLWGDRGVSLLGSASATEERVLPKAVSDGAGGIVVVWRNLRDWGASGTLPVTIEGQRVAPDGTLVWGTTPRVLRTTNLLASDSYGMNAFQVVGDGAGGAIAAFNDWASLPGQDLAMDVMAQRISTTGDLLWGSGAVVTAASGHQQHEQTLAGPAGSAFVFVYESVSESLSRLRAFRLNSDGSHSWLPGGLLLSDPASVGLDYGVSGSFDAGMLRVAWTRLQSPLRWTFDVLFSALTQDGTPLVSRFPVTTVPDAQFHRETRFSPQQRRVFITWDDRRKGSWEDMDIYGARVDDGVALPSLSIGDTSVSE